MTEEEHDRMLEVLRQVRREFVRPSTRAMSDEEVRQRLASLIRWAEEKFGPIPPADTEMKIEEVEEVILAMRRARAGEISEDEKQELLQKWVRWAVSHAKALFIRGGFDIRAA